MKVGIPFGTDKIIVDRSRRVRNPDVSRAIKATRQKLNEGGKADFSEDILRKHARTLIALAPFIPFMLLATAGIATTVGFGYEALLWVVAACFPYGMLSIISLRLEKVQKGKLNIATWSRLLMAGHFATGLAWIWFASFQCAECGTANMGVVQAVVILLAMAGTAVVTSTLSGALFATFAAPVAAFTVLTANLHSPVELAITITLYAGLLFFSLIERFMGRSTHASLQHQIEKDQLIAELETAKSFSDEARNRAEEANLAKSRFLASMSHELRTPLNAILGFSEVMAQEVLGPMENVTYKEYARDINDSGKHLLDLINEILDLSRIEAGRHTLTEDVVRLPEVAEDAVHLMTLRAKAKDITINPLFEPNMPPIWVDERSVRQIMLNLLSNAVKFTPTGGEIIVKVGWTNGGGQYMSVKDNGPGIPEDEIPVVLSAFGQGSIAIKNAEQGTGLGLPIVQAMMNMHDGIFEFRSKLREGTEAIAIFPPQPSCHCREEDEPDRQTFSGQGRRTGIRRIRLSSTCRKRRPRRTSPCPSGTWPLP